MLLRKFIKHDSGASAAEYALIIAIVGVGIGAAALALGANVEAAIGGASDEVAACGDGTASAGVTEGELVTDYTAVKC